MADYRVSAVRPDTMAAPRQPMKAKATSARMMAMAMVAAESISTLLRGARICHGCESAPDRSDANARNWAVLAEGSGSGSRMRRL